MCWNADISLNTFVFACLALVFIWIANTFTKYKSRSFENKFMYALLFAVASMQLVEYFLWKNLKNSARNLMLSRTAITLIVAQHLLVMAMIPNRNTRFYMYLAYAFAILLFYYFKYPSVSVKTSVAKNGHLCWEWMNFKGLDLLWVWVGLLFYLVPALLIGDFLFIFFNCLLFAVSLFYYAKFNTFGTVWCWAVNLFFFVFLVDILLVKPYREYNGLC
jgi:hypothetical protein